VTGRAVRPRPAVTRAQASPTGPPHAVTAVSPVSSPPAEVPTPAGKYLWSTVDGKGGDPAPTDQRDPHRSRTSPASGRRRPEVRNLIRRLTRPTENTTPNTNHPAQRSADIVDEHPRRVGMVRIPQRIEIPTGPEPGPPTRKRRQLMTQGPCRTNRPVEVIAGSALVTRRASRPAGVKVAGIPPCTGSPPVPNPPARGWLPATAVRDLACRLTRPADDTEGCTPLRRHAAPQANGVVMVGIPVTSSGGPRRPEPGTPAKGCRRTGSGIHPPAEQTGEWHQGRRHQ